MNQTRHNPSRAPRPTVLPRRKKTGDVLLSPVAARVICDLAEAMIGDGLRLGALEAGKDEVAAAICAVMTPRQHALIGLFNRRTEAEVAKWKALCEEFKL
ncbi:MAG: hypothetical protein LBQ81_08615 [Zoogloeaceae bacterium]|jgi:hypothetical protein|nr:hypothetical protein [Zoogloeaceae bacterium]